MSKELLKYLPKDLAPIVTSYLYPCPKIWNSVMFQLQENFYFSTACAMDSLINYTGYQKVLFGMRNPAWYRFRQGYYLQTMRTKHENIQIIKKSRCCLIM